MIILGILITVMYIIIGAIMLGFYELVIPYILNIQIWLFSIPLYILISIPALVYLYEIYQTIKYLSGMNK